MKTTAVRGTLLIAMSCVTMLFLGVFQAWSLFGIILSDCFPDWSASALSLNYTILNTCFCLGSLASGKLHLRLGGRKLLRLGALLCLCGGWLFSFVFRFASAAALPLLYLSYGFLGGIGSGICYNALMSGVSAAVRGRGALVSGATLTAFGFGGMIVGAAVNRLADGIGLGAAFRLVITVTAVFAAVTSLLLGRESSSVQAADASDSAEGIPAGKMLRTAEFWLYFAWAVLLMAVGFTIINSAAPIAVSVGAAGSIGMLVSIFNGLSRIGIGAFCDRFGSVKSRVIAGALGLFSGLTLLFSSFSGSAAAAILGVILAGMTYGCAVSMNAIVIRESFGKKYYAENYSIITVAGIPATYLGASVSGVLIDRFGGYRSSFVEVTVYAALAAVLLLLLLRIQKKKLHT